MLNCPVPDEPPPHANDRVEVHKAVEKIVKDAITRWMQIFVVSGAVLAVAFY